MIVTEKDEIQKGRKEMLKKDDWKNVASSLVLYFYTKFYIAFKSSLETYNIFLSSLLIKFILYVPVILQIF